MISWIFAVLFLYHSNAKAFKLTLAFVLISLLQSILAFSGYYQTNGTPSPKFILLLLPTLILFMVVFKKDVRKKLIAQRNLHVSTLLHTIRIPIEIGLVNLFYYKMIPELMTFEGRNFDIIAGLTAPLIAFLFYKKLIGSKSLLVWNVICLGLVLFIMINGILSAETPIQQFAFDQPNRGLIYFPSILLPAAMVPIVIFTHIIDILKLKAELANQI